MIRLRRLVFVTLAACGTTDHHNGGDAGGDGAIDSPPDGPPGGFYTIPLATPTGADQGSFYTATLNASGASFLLDIDTGSTVTGIAGSACTTCTGLSPLYMPGTGAMDTGRTDSAMYADGSGWSGKIYSDSVGLGHGTADVGVGFVSITSQNMFFSGNEYQGIFGLGPDALLDPGTTAYFDKLVATGVPAVMSFEMCPADGTMWLGGYDQTHLAAPLQYTPLLVTGVNKDFYSVRMTAMAIGGTSLGVTATQLDSPIVDTGTSLFYIPTKAETTLLAQVNANANFKTLFPGQTLSDAGDGCVTAAATTTAAMVDAMLPPLQMTFSGMGGGTFMLSSPPMASYLYDAGNGKFCLGVFGGGDNGEATMGDAFMRGYVTVIDLVNKQVGFAPTSHCAAPARPHVGVIHERGRGPHHVRR
jgi:Eukaryotic aspartyl protease